MEKDIKNIISSLELSPTNIDLIESIKYHNPYKETMENMIKVSNEKIKREDEYKENVLNTLKQIENNTENLTTIVELIKNSSEYQEEILSVITELLAIAKEVNKKEAESKYRKIISKIGNLTTDVETITKLSSFATTVYTVLNSNGII